MIEFLESIIKRDPAAKSKLSVVLTYPGVKAIFFHRIANFFSIANFDRINECLMASFKVEDGAPPLILCRHGIAAVLALSRTGLIPPILVIAL